MTVCDKCGKEVDDRDRFCHACGAPIAGVTQGKEVTQAPAAAVKPALPVSLSEEELRAKAEKKVKARVVMLRHAGVYVIMNLFFVAVWALTGNGYPWFLWSVIGWGLGLALHALGYFLGSRSEAVMHKLVEREMEKLGRPRG